MTDPRADGLGVSTCIELALKDAGIEKEQVRHRPKPVSLWNWVISVRVAGRIDRKVTSPLLESGGAHPCQATWDRLTWKLQPTS